MNWPEFAAIAVAHLFAVASPGPDFAVVARQSVAGGARAGLWTSAGVGAGILVHATYCVLGFALLLTRFPALFSAMRYLAAAYLLYLGARSFRASMRAAEGDAAAPPAADGPGRAFARGFLTNGLNPKATLFFLALFTVVVDASTPAAVQAFYGAYLALATFAWFGTLSLLLGRPAARGAMLRAGVWFDRGMGAVLVLLAARIALA